MMYINTKNQNTQSPSTPNCKYLGISVLLIKRISHQRLG